MPTARRPNPTDTLLTLTALAVAAATLAGVGWSLYRSVDLALHSTTVTAVATGTHRETTTGARVADLTYTADGRTYTIVTTEQLAVGDTVTVLRRTDDPAVTAMPEEASPGRIAWHAAVLCVVLAVGVVWALV